MEKGNLELCGNKTTSSTTAHQHADADTAVATDPLDELSETGAAALAIC